jgi:hypothetical protein
MYYFDSGLNVQCLFSSTFFFFARDQPSRRLAAPSRSTTLVTRQVLLSLSRALGQEYLPWYEITHSSECRYLTYSLVRGQLPNIPFCRNAV